LRFYLAECWNRWATERFRFSPLRSAVSANGPPACERLRFRQPAGHLVHWTSDDEWR